MATLTWQGTTTSFTASANWGGSSPADGDTLLFIEDNSQDITTDLSASGLDNITIKIGPKHRGKIGASAASPLVLGTGLTVQCAGPNVAGVFLSCTSATLVNLSDSPTMPGGFTWVAGTITELNVGGRGMPKFVGGTITLGHLLSSQATALIESGTTLTTWRNMAGKCDCSVVPTTVYVAGGEFELKSQSSGTVTLLEVQSPQARVRLREKAATFTRIRVLGGIVDRGRMNSAAVTITDSDVYAGGTLNIDNGMDNVTTTNAIVNRGGVVYRGASASVSDKFGFDYGIGGGFGAGI